MTGTEFVQKAKRVHHNKYDYSVAIYTKPTTKVSILCPLHGVFMQRPSNHLRGNGCPKCAREAANKRFRLSQNEAETRLNLRLPIHYSYKPFKYLNGSTLIQLHCNKHDIFWKMQYKRIFNHGDKNGKYQGCKVCLCQLGYPGYSKELYCNEQEKERIKKLALTCSTRSEFISKYPTEYDRARRYGWRKYIFSNMKRAPNLSKRLVYVFLIRIENINYVYVGLTYNMKRRLNEHNNNPNSAIGNFCIEHNLSIPKPTIIASNLSEEDAAELEFKWIERFKNTPNYVVLNRAIGGSLGNHTKYRLISNEEIIAEAQKYNSRSEWRLKNGASFRQAQNRGLLNELMPPKTHNEWTLEEAFLVCSSYNNYASFC